MKRKRHGPEEIIRKLREAEALAHFPGAPPMLRSDSLLMLLTVRIATDAVRVAL